MDYYQVLGVSRNASEQEIHDSYKEMKNHYEKFEKVRHLTRYEKHT